MPVEATTGSAMLTLQLLRIQTPRTPVASVIATIDRALPQPSAGASVPPLGPSAGPRSTAAPAAASAYAEF